MAAAEQGQAGAMYNLAIIARNEGNQDEYVRLVTQSANLRYSRAQRKLGCLFHNGSYGHEKSIETALRNYSLAAKQGDELAKIDLNTTLGNF